MSKSNVSAPRVAWTVWRYGLALLSVALALGFALLAWHAGIRRVELTIFLLGIAVTAWYGGAGPAVVVSCNGGSMS